jgi:hypothetical protein
MPPLAFPAYKVQDAYRWSSVTGVIPAALAANSEILQFRWTSAIKYAAIRKVRISAAVSTTFFAAGVPIQLSMLKATAFTAAGTGGTATALGAQNKMDTRQASSAVAEIRIAAAAALGVGTKTLETIPVASILLAGPITLSLDGTITPGKIDLFSVDYANDEKPMILAANEGFAITVPAVPATGTWQVGVEILWDELTIA